MEASRGGCRCSTRRNQVSTTQRAGRCRLPDWQYPSFRVRRGRRRRCRRGRADQSLCIDYGRWVPQLSGYVSPRVEITDATGLHKRARLFCACRTSGEKPGALGAIVDSGRSSLAGCRWRRALFWARGTVPS